MAMNTFSTADFIVVTTETIPGTEILSVIGMVRSARPIYLEADQSVIDTAIAGMIDEATKRGANAITGFRFAVTSGLVMAYGTSVVATDNDK